MINSIVNIGLIWVVIILVVILFFILFIFGVFSVFCMWVMEFYECKVYVWFIVDLGLKIIFVFYSFFEGW